MVQQLKQQFKQSILDDELLQAQIAKATNRKISTVKRWVEENHIMLTTSAVLDTIRSYENIPAEEDLTEASLEPAA